MPGPLPQAERRRRNAPTIPTTNLPASGRPGPAPKRPSFMRLGKSGAAWWSWAWKQPQAAAWAKGHEVAICRRAQLEDMWSATPTLALAREIRELEDRLGLTPKGMAALRWTIVDDPPADVTGDTRVSGRGGRFAGLEVVRTG